MMNKIYSIVLVSLVFASVSAQDLVTDRPDQTESASIVPKLHFQLESGMVFTELDMITDNTDIQSLLRVGLLSNLELRLGFTNSSTEIKNNPIKSVSNIVFPGLKYQLFKGVGIIPDIAVMGGFAVPLSYDDGADNFWAPELRVAAQHDLLDVLGVGYNYGVFWDSDSYDTHQFYSVAVGLDIIPKTGLFVEFFGENFQNIGSSGYVDGGVTFSLINNLQLDAYLGYGLNNHADDMFVGVGFTVRIPK